MAGEVILRGRAPDWIPSIAPHLSNRPDNPSQHIRYEVAAGVQGHILDQVCQAPADPEQWLITSEWETLDDFLRWEQSPDHRKQAGPMRACMTEARSIKFVVREETSKSRLAG